MKYFLTVINLILITMIVYLGVQLFYQITLSQVHVASKDVKRINFHKNRPTKPQMAKPIESYRQIAKRDLFNLQSKMAKQPKPDHLPDVENIDHTELDIHLWGTVSGEINSASYAVIESSVPQQRRYQQRLYQEGDTVLSAKIEKIYRDKVILNVDGDRQILTMEKYKNSSRRPRRTRHPASTTPLKYTRTIKHKQIENAFENLNSIMKQARIRPIARGMSISGIRSNSIFRRLGLRNGDVIVGVNGEKLKSVEDALSLYHGLQTGSQVTINLERRRRPVTITYAIN